MSEPIAGEIGVEALRRQVKGPVLQEGDGEVSAETSGQNLAAKHRPGVVVGAADQADVAAAVRFASERGLPVAVQVTGHGSSRDEGAVMITTRRLDEVTIDPANRRARVGAGARWRDVIDAAVPHGLATLSGSSSSVGVVGYTVGGGIGPLVRPYGYAADHVRSMDVVTADGELRPINAVEAPDLFWGMLGGKDNLGIVTAMEFDLMPVARLYGGGIYFSGDDAAAVLHAYQAWAPSLPERTTTSFTLLRLPDLEMVAEPLRGRLTVQLTIAHLGSAEQGERLLAPMRAVAPAIVDDAGDMPFAAVDSIHRDPPDPMPYWETGRFLHTLGAETVDALLAAAGPQSEIPLTLIGVRHIAGAADCGGDNCVGGRGAPWLFEVIGGMPPPLREAVPLAGKAVADALAPWSTGLVPVNFVNPTLGDLAPGLAWNPEDRDRLLALKQRYDPANTFRCGYPLA